MGDGSSSFAADKARVLGQVDLSRKGSVDAAIVPLLAYLNAQKCFYSTSSCAGRLLLFTEVHDPPLQPSVTALAHICRVEIEGRKVASGYLCHMTPWTPPMW